MTPPIGVLLPVRLETLADQRADGGWTLSLRIVPDDVHLDRHDPRCTDAELDLLDAVWSGGGAGFDAGFATLVARVGGPRALWLVRSFPAGYDRGAVPRRIPGLDAPGYAKIGAFPSRYGVWAIVGGVPSLLAEQSVAIDELVLDPLAPLAERWWSDWDKAKAVGLGLEIDLGALDPTSPAFQALVVAGLDDNVDPAPLFVDHANAGRLALLDHGTPTNSVAGVPTVDLDGAPDEWRGLVDAAQPVLASQLAEALGVPAPGLPPIRVGVRQRGTHTNTAKAPWDGELTTALWSALWGFAGHELWGWGNAVHDAAAWASTSLRPLGPLPAVRVGDQPYGVLPVTSLSRWKHAAGDPMIERTLLPRLDTLRTAAKKAARARGTTSDADAARWLELMADTPTTPAFGARWMLPLEMAQQLSTRPDELERWWQQLAKAVLDLARPPARPYVAISTTHPLDIPLVHPKAWDPDGSRSGLVQKMLHHLATVADSGQWGRLVQPVQLFQPFWAPKINENTPVPDSLLVRLAWRSLLVAVGHAITERTGQSILDPVVVSDAGGTLPDPLLDEILRTAGAFGPGGTPAGDVLVRTIRALRALSGSSDEELEIALRAVLDTASHRVDPWITAFATRRLQAQRADGAPGAAGIYGWVDGPLVGKPGPTEAGVLLATSDSQARTAAVLRDKAISDPEGRWQMDLESRVVAAAVRVADEVAQGTHPGEVMGRRIEHELAMRDRIDEVRRRFPLRTGDQGRRVCDGLAVLAPGADLTFLTAAELEAIDALRPVLDAYADLLVADGVHQMIEARPERARRSMEAAVGLGVPPDLDVVRSPRPGRTAMTTVLVALPDTGVADAAHPATLVDAAVAVWLDDTLPDPDDAAWNWRLAHADGSETTLTLGNVSLAPSDTPLRASDALALGRIAVDQMVRQQTQATTILARPTAFADGEYRIELLRAPPYVDPNPGDSPGDDARVELAARYAAARDVAKSLRQQARTPGLTATEQAKILSTLRPWGVVPPSDATAGELLDAAASALEVRLSATAPQPSASDPVGAPETATAAALDGAALAAALVHLVCPGSPFPVLARRSASMLAALVSPTPAELGDWLGTVATVRPGLALHDADQLVAQTLTVRVDRAGDLWQQSAVPQDSTTRLTVAFGTAEAFEAQAGSVAVGEIDRFTESIPAARVATGFDAHERALTGAVGFNAPGARAPQAVLLAVPPDVSTSIDAATLVDIVCETRDLAHARLARLIDLDAFATGLPGAWLPKAWVSGVELTIDREI